MLAKVVIVKTDADDLVMVVLPADFNAGTHTLTAKLRFADFKRLVQPRIASLSGLIG